MRSKAAHNPRTNAVNSACHFPGFALRVKLRAEHKLSAASAYSHRLTAVCRRLPGNPGRESGAQKVQRKKTPTRGPEQQIGLALQRINIRKKARSMVAAASRVNAM